MRLGALAGGIAAGYTQGMDLIQRQERIKLEQERSKREGEAASRAATEFKWRELDRDQDDKHKAEIGNFLGSFAARFQPPAQATAIPPDANGMTSLDGALDGATAPAAAPAGGRTRTPTPMDLAELYMGTATIGAKYGRFDKAALGDAFKIFEGEQSKEKEAAARQFFSTGDASGLMKFAKELGLPENAKIDLTSQPDANGRPVPTVTITGQDGVPRHVPATPWLMSLGFLNQANAANAQDSASRAALQDAGKAKVEAANIERDVAAAGLARTQAAEIPGDRALKADLTRAQIRNLDGRTSNIGASGGVGSGGSGKGGMGEWSASDKAVWNELTKGLTASIPGATDITKPGSPVKDDEAPNLFRQFGAFARKHGADPDEAADYARAEMAKVNALTAKTLAAAGKKKWTAAEFVETRTGIMNEVRSRGAQPPAAAPAPSRAAPAPAPRAAIPYVSPSQSEATVPKLRQ